MPDPQALILRKFSPQFGLHLQCLSSNAMICSISTLDNRFYNSLFARYWFPYTPSSAFRYLPKPLFSCHRYSSSSSIRRYLIPHPVKEKNKISLVICGPLSSRKFREPARDRDSLMVVKDFLTSVHEGMRVSNIHIRTIINSYSNI